MSVTADSLLAFVMQNQDQDPLVKKCFEISRTMLSVNSVNAYNLKTNQRESPKRRIHILKRKIAQCFKKFLEQNLRKFHFFLSINLTWSFFFVQISHFIPQAVCGTCISYIFTLNMFYSCPLGHRLIVST